MKALDPITVRLFPTLAAYTRKVRRRELLALIGITLSAYLLGRDLLSAYQSRAATENMTAMVGRVNSLETTCQKEHPKRFVTTKAQAAVWDATREKAKEQ
jgi:hypothetical protein